MEYVFTVFFPRAHNTRMVCQANKHKRPFRTTDTASEHNTALNSYTSMSPNTPTVQLSFLRVKTLNTADSAWPAAQQSVESKSPYVWRSSRVSLGGEHTPFAGTPSGNRDPGPPPPTTAPLPPPPPVPVGTPLAPSPPPPSCPSKMSRRSLPLLAASLSCALFGASIPTCAGGREHPAHGGGGDDDIWCLVCAYSIHR